MRPSQQLAQSHSSHCAAHRVLAEAETQRDIALPLKVPGRALVDIRKPQALKGVLVKAVFQTSQVLMVDLGMAVSRNLLLTEDQVRLSYRILKLMDLARMVQVRTTYHDCIVQASPGLEEDGHSHNLVAALQRAPSAFLFHSR